MGGIWEINFCLPPRGGAGCQVPHGAVDGASVRLAAAVRCQRPVEHGNGGVRADRRPGPERASGRDVGNSKHPEGPRLLIPAAEWRAFLRDLKADWHAAVYRPRCRCAARG